MFSRMYKIPTKLIALATMLMSCGRPDGYVDSIDDKYQLYHANRTVDLLTHSNTLLIQDIWGYTKDDSFVLAYRKTNEPGYESVENDKEWNKTHPNDTIQYWMVKTDTYSVIGPMTYPEYINTRSKFYVNPSLILQIDRDSVVRY